MGELSAGAFGIVGVLVFLFLLVLAILWFILPFAIFGTKDKLEALISESRKTNVELARIAAELSAHRLQMQQHQSAATSSDGRNAIRDS